jgi:hypothetical protein
MHGIQSDVASYQREHLQKLADSGAKVYEPKFDERPAWKAARLRAVFERLATRVTAYDASIPDFTVRKELLEDKEFLEFYRGHQKLYYELTDRNKLADSKFRSAFSLMLATMAKIEAGKMSKEEADGFITKQIVSLLS